MKIRKEILDQIVAHAVEDLPNECCGLLLGTALFANDYIALPVAGLYKPIWEYDAKTLAWDLGAHLAYGAGTGTTFWLVTRI